MGLILCLTLPQGSLLEKKHTHTLKTGHDSIEEAVFAVPSSLFYIVNLFQVTITIVEQVGCVCVAIKRLDAVYKG